MATRVPARLSNPSIAPDRVRAMSLLGFCEWLASTPWSIALHESRYLFIVVLTIHVLTLTVFVGTAVIIDLRFMGLAMLRVPASEIMTRLLPWATAGFLVMIASGALLFYAAPVLRYQNLFFRLKMVVLALAVVNAWVFFKTVYRSVADWDLDPIPPRRARVAGAVSLVLLAIVITTGRFIPYQLYWFPCNSQPPHPIVDLLSGCPADSR